MAASRVYLAIDVNNNNLIAAKEFALGHGSPKSTEDIVLALQKEITVMKELEHENVVRYYGADRRGQEAFYILMEYVPGGSLRSVLEQFGAMQAPLAADITLQILQGLEYIHSKSIVHRDIKAANVLLSSDGVAKIGDFGALK